MSIFWKNEPWVTDPWLLIEALNGRYESAVAAGRTKGWISTTAKKLLTARGWAASTPAQALRAAIQGLEVMFCPAGLSPGPAFVTPIRDVTDEVRRAQIRLLHNNYGDLRWLSIGDASKFIGPAWAGNDGATLALIIRTGSVVVVEGVMDLIAAKVVAPGVPVLSPLGKKLSPAHLDYLQLMGVERVYTLWDDDAAGRRASTRNLPGPMRTIRLSVASTGAEDPADALKTTRGAWALKEVLRGVALTSLSLPVDED